METSNTDSTIPPPEALLAGRDQVLNQMEWTRRYTLELASSIPSELWYVRPGNSPTHLAWQLGHLAVSQYGLMLFRQRGRAAGDLELMPGWWRKQFGRGTNPMERGEKSPTPEQLLLRLSDIHSRSLAEAARLSSETLAEPTEMPYAAFPIKLGALLFCPIHEAIHAGQIGLLRRLHGLEPQR